MMERARELGRLLGQSVEYQTLRRAREGVAGDRELAGLLNRLAELESEVARALETGDAPSEAVQQDYETLVSRVQESTLYQALVAAQMNFDKLLGRVNAEMGRGMDAGSQSRIILPH